MRSTKIIKICSSSLCTCLHHMVILRTRNKITDFLMILAWASPFNHCTRSPDQASAEGHSVLKYERFNVGIRVGQHLRRWLNNKPTLGKCLREDWLLLAAPEIRWIQMPARLFNQDPDIWRYLPIQVLVICAFTTYTFPSSHITIFTKLKKGFKLHLIELTDKKR